MKPFHTLLALALLVWLPPASVAQDAYQGRGELLPPLRIVAVDGAATLLRDGEPVTLEPNVPLVEGDRLRTRDGRVELGLPSGSSLFLDRWSTLDVRRPERVRLIEGRLRIVSTEDHDPLTLRVDGPGATLESASAMASFTVEVGTGPRGTDLWLRVDAGVVEVQGEYASTLVRGGETVQLRSDGTPEPATGYARAERAEFDSWVDGRLAEARGASPAATAARSYLPPGLRAHASTLSRYGQWEYEPDYGYVWYPTVVVDWRPYWRGRWDRVGYYGWFWIGADPWAWPTHHYGRWGYRHNRWFWIPQPVWAPAWVSWAIGPGYVAWCPLGYHGAPVVGFGVTVATVGRGPVPYRSGGYFEYWRAWTVIDADRFHSRRYVWRRDTVDVRAWSGRDTAAFVTQRVPPTVRGSFGFAVRRDGRPDGALPPGDVGSGQLPPGGSVRVPAHSERRPGAFAPSVPVDRPDSPYLRAAPYAVPRSALSRRVPGPGDEEADRRTPGDTVQRATSPRASEQGAPSREAQPGSGRDRRPWILEGPGDPSGRPAPSPAERIPAVPRPLYPVTPERESPYERAWPFMTPRRPASPAPESPESRGAVGRTSRPVGRDAAEEGWSGARETNRLPSPWRRAPETAPAVPSDRGRWSAPARPSGDDSSSWSPRPLRAPVTGPREDGPSRRERSGVSPSGPPERRGDAAGRVRRPDSSPR